jgi:hypothetical protein
MVEFSDFRDLFTRLPSGALSLDDVRTAESASMRTAASPSSTRRLTT